MSSRPAGTSGILTGSLRDREMPVEGGAMDLVIRNCKFIYECPILWEVLDMTDQDNVRHCRVCNRDVFLCEDGDALMDALYFDRSVAVKGKVPDKPDQALTGIPDSKYVTFRYRDDLK